VQRLPLKGQPEQVEDVLEAQLELLRLRLRDLQLSAHLVEDGFPGDGNGRVTLDDSLERDRAMAAHLEGVERKAQQQTVGRALRGAGLQHPGQPAPNAGHLVGVEQGVDQLSRHPGRDPPERPHHVHVDVVAASSGTATATSRRSSPGRDRSADRMTSGSGERSAERSRSRGRSGRWGAGRGRKGRLPPQRLDLFEQRPRSSTRPVSATVSWVVEPKASNDSSRPAPFRRLSSKRHVAAVQASRQQHREERRHGGRGEDQSQRGLRHQERHRAERDGAAAQAPELVKADVG